MKPCACIQQMHALDRKSSLGIDILSMSLGKARGCSTYMFIGPDSRQQRQYGPATYLIMFVAPNATLQMGGTPISANLCVKKTSHYLSAGPLQARSPWHLRC